ncbi:hypothetical protein [Clostridium vincentii]|uniref:hypothetical protein n=1 Tax=Clostridium vincentii TaxID=52704 RepID=UPI001A9A6914|nr:hypothetical protein [Clostridium vincentii]
MPKKIGDKKLTETKQPLLVVANCLYIRVQQLIRQLTEVLCDKGLSHSIAMVAYIIY